MQEKNYRNKQKVLLFILMSSLEDKQLGRNEEPTFSTSSDIRESKHYI